MAAHMIPGRDYRPRVGQKTGPLYGGIEQPEGGAVDGLMAAGETAHDVYGASPFVGPLASQPAPSADKLNRGIALADLARQQDFANHYMGSQIAPMWTPALQALSMTKSVKGEPGPTMGPSGAALSTMSNPAGMTQSGTMQAARDVAEGGAMPDWYSGAQPDTQESFRTRMQQAMSGLRRAR